MSSVLPDLTGSGFAVVPEALTQAELEPMLAAVEDMQRRAGSAARAGRRDLFSVLPVIRDLAAHPAVRAWPAAVLGSSCFAVRAVLFDKTPRANWKVAWHQDLTIATRCRLETPGFGPWSEKEGIPHVHAPAAVLERMLSVRIHLDPCGSDDGPLLVLPGSHRHGRLAEAAMSEWKSRVAPVETPCPAGGLQLMRPLLLHASSAARQPAHRRVIHLEYAVDPLPGRLEWRERWGVPAAGAA